MNRYRFLPSYRYYEAEGESSVVLENTAGKPLRDYRIYGNTVDGVSCGDKTKNLFNADAVDGVYGFNGVISNSYGGMSEDGILTINRSLYGGGIYVPFGVKQLKSGSYTISALVYATKTANIRLGVVLKDKTSIGKTLVVSNNEWVYISTMINFEEDVEILGLQIQGSGSTDYNNQGTLFKEIQVEYGTATTEYEPYGYKIPIVRKGPNIEPIAFNIYLDEPLYDGDSIGFLADDLPKISTEKNCANIVEVNTEVPPSKIWVQYYK
jgi:hypothetical protein